MPVVLRRTTFAAALAVVMFLMLRPAQEVSTSNDKFDHLIVFGVLAALGLWARVRPVWLVAGLAAYAVLTEVLQATVTTSRFGDPKDALADMVGVLLVVGAYAAIARIRTVRGASSAPRRPRA